MAIDFQRPRTSSSQTGNVPMPPCKNAWLPFARVATPGLFSAAKNAPFFSHKSTAANLEMRFNLIRHQTQRFPARCQLGRVGSCVTTMAALAARINRNTYTYHIRATYVALRLSAVQNLLQARLGGICGASLVRMHLVAPCPRTASHT